MVGAIVTVVLLGGAILAMAYVGGRLRSGGSDSTSEPSSTPDWDSTHGDPGGWDGGGSDGGGGDGGGGSD